MSENDSSAIVMSLVQGLIADTSVGLKAVAVAKAKWKESTNLGVQFGPACSSLFISGEIRVGVAGSRCGSAAI
jgi:hypothetical protein